MQWKYILSVIALIAMTNLSHAARAISDDNGGGSTDIPQQSSELTPGAPAVNSVPTTVDQRAWETAHANSANTGFARVDTAPAVTPMRVTQVGLVAPGANPVVAPDGTVYIGTMQGDLRAFHADGTPSWTRQLNHEHGGIFASPAVGADGSVYVISTNIVRINDHQGDGEVYSRLHSDSYLHKFTPGAGWVYAQPFPEHYANIATIANRGATTTPPNIWRWNGTEAIMVPVVYQAPVGKELRLLAFSTGGGVFADHLVTAATSPETTGGDEDTQGCIDLGPLAPFCLLGYFVMGDIFGAPDSSIPLADAGFPMPGVAIRQEQRGAPLVVMTDGKQDKIALAFSPQTGFSEVSRSSHLRRTFTTPPVVQGSRAMVGTTDGFLTFTDANFAQLPAISTADILTAAPTLLADGHVAVIGRSGTLNIIDSLLNGYALEWQEPLNGASIAAAAASCTHFFVATTDELATFSAKNLMRVSTLAWVDGGLSAPVIGPAGHVYVAVSSNLWVFPPPKKSIADQVTGRTACDGLVGNSPGLSNKP